MEEGLDNMAKIYITIYFFILVDTTLLPQTSEKLNLSNK